MPRVRHGIVAGPAIGVFLQPVVGEEDNDDENDNDHDGEIRSTTTTRDHVPRGNRGERRRLEVITRKPRPQEHLRHSQLRRRPAAEGPGR